MFIIISVFEFFAKNATNSGGKTEQKKNMLKCGNKIN
jgi:hypothetical protein